MANFPVPKARITYDPAIIGSADIYITESDQDATAAVNAGFPAISFPNNLRTEENYIILIEACSKSKKIFILNSTNNTQRLGEIGYRISKAGIGVFILTVSDGLSAVNYSFTDWFKTHQNADLKALARESPGFIDVLIKKLPENFSHALPDIQEKILPLVLKLNVATQKHYMSLISKKVKTTAKIISELLVELISKAKADQKSADELENVDPEIEAAAMVLLQDPQLLKKRIDAVNRAGVVNERKNIAIYGSTFDSRLIKEGPIPGQNVLAVKNAGHFGAGKSYSLFLFLSILPEGEYHLITSGSEKSLYYLENGLRHKMLVVTEGFQFTRDRGDSEIAYVVRSLLSEGKIIRLVSEKGEDGKISTKEVIIEGPTPFITTTIVDSLEPQLEDRMFTIHPDESSNQTKEIILNRGEQSAGNIGHLPDLEIKIWKQLHRMLEPISVVIPFAPDIASHIAKMQTIPIATRRAFNKVLNVIQAIACLYQHQRTRDEQGNVIAEICDYWMGLQIVYEAFKENLGQESKVTNDRLEYLKSVQHASVKDLSRHFGVSRSAISVWAKRAEEDTLVSWVDDKGAQFKDDNAVKKGKRAGKAHLTAVEQSGAPGLIGLPQAHDLMESDPVWAPGGTEYDKFHLHLTPDIPKVASSPVPVPAPVPPVPECGLFPVSSRNNDTPFGAPPVGFIQSGVSNNDEVYGAPPKGFSALKDEPQKQERIPEPGDDDYVNPLI